MSHWVRVNLPAGGAAGAGVDTGGVSGGFLICSLPHQGEGTRRRVGENVAGGIRAGNRGHRPPGGHNSAAPVPGTGAASHPYTESHRMKLSRFLSVLLATVLATGGLHPRLARAADADDTTEFLKPDNWEGRTDLWKVEGRSIVGETKQDPKYNTFLCSKQKYSDFELSFKIQLRDEVGNSGVQIRSTVTDPQKFVVAGPQADIGKGYWGSLYGEKFTKDGKIGGGHMMKAA